MKSKLLEFLICPQCAGPYSLKVQHREGDEVLEGELTCAKCSQAFAISRGIPRFVPRLSQETSQTTEGFGYEWNKFNEAIKGGNMSAEFLFLDFISPVVADFFQDKVVLDGGCGMGRFSMQAAKWGAREVIAVDLGPAVEAAYHNTRSLPNVHVIQADLCALPLRAAFDYVFSVGVLHHLADPKRGFVQISRLLKPRGHLSAWVYAREGNEWVERFITPFRKHVTSRMPKALLLGLSYVLGVILYGGIKLIYTPVNRLNALRWLRRRMFYNDYLYYLGSVGFSGVVSVIFDQLVPSLAAYVPKEDLVDWISSARLECLSITSRTNNSWRLLARNSSAIAPTANEQ